MYRTGSAQVEAAPAGGTLIPAFRRKWRQRVTGVFEKEAVPLVAGAGYNVMSIGLVALETVWAL